MNDDAKDAERLRHILNIYSNFMVHDVNLGKLLKSYEVRKAIDNEILEGTHKNSSGDPDLPAEEFDDDA